jgi:hypothetical protein
MLFVANDASYVTRHGVSDASATEKEKVARIRLLGLRLIVYFGREFDPSLSPSNMTAVSE